MAVTTPPSITALPAAPDPADRATFNARAFPWATALNAFRTDISSVASNVFNNATDAEANANTALTQAGLALTRANNAATSAGNALNSETNALASANNAAASATTAVNAPGTSATSATSVVVGLGSKSLTVEAGKILVAGASVKIASTATPTTWMHGDITSYNSGTGALIVNVTTINGSGTLAAWTVSLSAPAGVSTYPKQAVSDKTAAYTLVAGDHATTIRTTSGTGDITLLASATAGVGFTFNYVNETAAVRYINRSGSDTFQGGETLIFVPPGGALTIVCATASASGKWKVLDVSATGNGSNSIALGWAVASGGNSIAMGANGQATASGANAIALGGTASGGNSINIGYGTSSNASSVNVGGQSATAASAIAIGASANASGMESVAIGNNTANAQRAIAVGSYALADFAGKFAHGSYSARGAGSGWSQYARTVLSANATATNTNYTLTSDGNAVGLSNIVNVPLSRLVTFTATVSAGRLATLGAESAGWEVKGVIRRGNTGNVAFVGTPTVTSLGGTVPTGWTLTATADITNQGLALVFNMGATAMTNVYVSAAVHASEVQI